MSADKGAVVLCPMCKAENDPGAAKCFLCDQSLVGGETVDGKKRGALAAKESRWWRAPHVSAFLILIALVAVNFGVAAVGGALAVPFAIFPFIALCRLVACFYPNRSGFRSAVASAGLFVLVLVVGIAAFGAFCVTCAAIALSGANFH